MRNRDTDLGAQILHARGCAHGKAHRSLQEQEPRRFHTRQAEGTAARLRKKGRDLIRHALYHQERKGS